MTNLINRIFAKKIEGEELKNLFEALEGVDSIQKEFLNNEGPYIRLRGYGKLYIQPLKEGLEINLEMFVKKEDHFYLKEGQATIVNILGTPKITKKTFQIKKIIPYSELQKIKFLEN